MKSCKALVGYAFRELNLNRVEIRYAEKNSGSGYFRNVSVFGASIYKGK